MSLPDLYLIGTVLVVAICASLMARLLPPRSPTPPRHGALQGFRGLLAFGVFMHHSFLWSRYARGQGWADADVWHQFGESRVVLFFMLTATLFYGRLLDARGRNLDWLKLYVSRVLRLSPAYAFSMVLMFAVIAWATVHQIDGAGTSIVKFTWSDIVGTATTWLAFCMLGMPSIDGYMATPAVTAGVTWTMPYEVTFYLLLPLLALPLRVRMPATTLGLGLAAAIWTMLWPSTPEYCVPFAGGLAVAMLVRLPRVVAVLRRRFFAVPAMAAMISAIVFFPTVYAPVPLLLLFFSMAVFACDNDLFGILRWRAPQALGQWAYSLYLLHGIALYTLFLCVIGRDRATHLSDLQYALIVAAFVPVVLALSWASQRWVESPPMRAVPAVVAAIRRWLPQRAAAGGAPAAPVVPAVPRGAAPGATEQGAA